MTNIEYVNKLAAMYLCKSEDPKELKKAKPIPYCKDGYSWYSVGHNSNCFFYLAVDSEGNLWQRSLICDYDYDNHIDNDREHIALLPSQDSVQYIGHW